MNMASRMRSSKNLEQARQERQKAQEMDFNNRDQNLTAFRHQDGIIRLELEVAAGVHASMWVDQKRDHWYAKTQEDYLSVSAALERMPPAEYVELLAGATPDDFVPPENPPCS